MPFSSSNVILLTDEDGAVDRPRRLKQDHAVLDGKGDGANVQIKSPVRGPGLAA